MKLAVIGYGAIVGQMLGALGESGSAGEISQVVCLCRETSAERAKTFFAETANGMFLERCRLVHTVEALLDAAPEIAVEAAGHAAVEAYGPQILAGGVALIVCSVGALSDSALHEGLLQAAAQGGSRLHLPAGAIGAIDLLAAARLGGISDVLYTSRKPPAAWTGTPAAARIDLAALKEATAFFEGDARTAARSYPKNANVAATVALAGIGFDATRVRLIADPAAGGNTHTIEVKSASADFFIEIAGKPSPANPKTSMGTGLSVARLVLNHIVREVI